MPQSAHTSLDDQQDGALQRPSTTLGLLFSHLHISLEASYVSPVAGLASSSSNPVLIQSPSTGSGPFSPRPGPTTPRPNSYQPPLGRPSTAPPGRHPVPPLPQDVATPETPFPVPSTTTQDAAFARAAASDGGAVVQSYIWGEGREKEAVDAVGTAFSLFWDETQDAWVAVYKLDISVGQSTSRAENLELTRP